MLAEELLLALFEVGHYLEKPNFLLGKPFRKNPLRIWENLFVVVVVRIGRHFSLVYSLPRRRKNPFFVLGKPVLCTWPLLRLPSAVHSLFVESVVVSASCSGKNLFQENPLLSGACRGMCPFLGLLTAGPLGKTPLGEKTFIIVRKNPWPCGGTFIGGEKIL